MADGLSSTLTNALLDVLAGTAITANAYATSGNIYVLLHTADPGTSGATAVSVGSTTRESATFASASGGVISLSSSPSWTNGGTTETITDISVWSAVTSGTFLFSASLSASKAWASGDTLQLSSLSITIPTAS